MAEVEVPDNAPAWMLALEKKRHRVHQLAHEVGAGSPCLQCQDDCPGLDLHFWRKICRNCKCRKEDHDVIDDFGSEQFEILLGSGHANQRPKKAFLEMLEKHTMAGLKSKAMNVAFDWIPPDVSSVVATEYMQSLPASKLPISGSDGALYRRQQLERQLPLHDLDAAQCHQLTEAEVENLNKYLENLKNNVVGQGRVTKLPSSSSLDSLQKVCTFNSVPKPFQTSNGSAPSNPSPQFTVGDKVNAGKIVNLKPPSAFWPKSLSPEPPRSLSPAAPSSDVPLQSVADRGAAFGVKLSPFRKPVGIDRHLIPERDRSSTLENSANQEYVGGRLVNEQVHKSLAQSTDVQGNMWVPTECKDCCRRAVEGQLIRSQVCTHVAKSDDAAIHMQPMECSVCIKGSVDPQLLQNQICTHLDDPKMPLLKPEACSECIKAAENDHSAQGKFCIHMANTSIPFAMQPMTCCSCTKENMDGQLVVDQVCTHFGTSSVPHLIQPQECPECFKKSADGRVIQEKVCTHVAHSGRSLGERKPQDSFAHSELASRVPKGQLPVYGPTTNLQQSYPLLSDGSNDPKHLDHLASTNSAHKTPIQTGLLPLPLSDWNSGSSLPMRDSTTYASASPVDDLTTLPGLKIPPSVDCTKQYQSFTRDKSPPGMLSSPGAPHMMALYAHNALNSPSSIDPQDALSPHIASMSIDKDSQPIAAVDSDMKHSEDIMPLVDTLLECVHCEEDILPGEVVVFADRAGTDVVWHPKCFVCNTCQELLVDLVYFFNKGYVYCGRHYAEILDIPRCSACDELIFVKEYTVAEGQAFHVRHFCCFECDNPLGGKQYVPKEGQPVCLPCYEQKYGKQCETCHQVIKAQDQGVTWKDLHWHATPECFCCNYCNMSLLGGRFAVKDLRPFCCKECMQAGKSNQQKISAL